MRKSIASFLIISLTISTLYGMRSAFKKTRIADNQSPQAYLELGNYFLIDADGFNQDILLAVDAFEKAALQQKNLEVRAEAALQLGLIYYFHKGGLRDDKKLQQFLSVAGLAACQLSTKKEIIRMAQILRQPKPFDLQQENRRGESPLHYAAKKGYMRMLTLLFSLGAKIILEKELFGQTALYLACSNGRTAAATYLIEQGAETDTRGPLGSSLLHAGALHDHKEVLLLLLEKGLDIASHCDDFGLTAYYCAARYGHYDMACILLDHEGYADERDLQGWSCLHWAALEGDLEKVTFLLHRRVCIDGVTCTGDTPLHIAALMDHAHIIKYLRRKGADREVVNNEGKTAQECADPALAYLFWEELCQELSFSL